MDDLVLVELSNGVALVTLNNPALLNPISDIEMVDALTGALEALDRDLDTRCIILSGAGKGISSGSNLGRIASPGNLAAGRPPKRRQGTRLEFNASRCCSRPWQCRSLPLEEHLETAAAYQALAHTTADHHEAIAAFREKRPPALSGK